MTAKKKKEKTEELEIINFIYVNPENKEHKSKAKALEKLSKQHEAEVVYDSRVNPDFAYMTEEPLTDKELDFLKENNLEEM